MGVKRILLNKHPLPLLPHQTIFKSKMSCRFYTCDGHMHATFFLHRLKNVRGYAAYLEQWFNTTLLEPKCGIGYRNLCRKFSLHVEMEIEYRNRICDYHISSKIFSMSNFCVYGCVCVSRVKALVGSGFGGDSWIRSSWLPRVFVALIRWARAR